MSHQRFVKKYIYSERLALKRALELEKEVNGNLELSFLELYWEAGSAEFAAGQNGEFTKLKYSPWLGKLSESFLERTYRFYFNDQKINHPVLLVFVVIIKKTKENDWAIAREDVMRIGPDNASNLRNDVLIRREY